MIHMTRHKKKTCWGLASLLAPGLCLPAWAEKGGLQEVIVTAQKIEQNIQEVPIAMTAVTSVELEKKGITSFEGIARDTPSIAMAPDYTSRNTLILFMRGMGNVAPAAPNSEGAVGIYQDGFFIARANAITFDMADPERVEVLRGPQGTLYGRNTTGGAVNIISKQPAGEFKLKQSLDFGSRNYFRSLTSVDFPEWNNVSTKVTFLKSSVDGWIKNAGSSHDFNEEEQQGGRFQLHWQPSANFSLDYFGEMTDIDSTPGYFQNPSLEGEVFGGYPYTHSASRRRSTFAPLDLPQSSDTLEGHGLTLTWDINDQITIKSLTGYRETDVDSFQDFAYALFGSAYTQHDLFTSRQFSQELQVSGNFLNDRLNAILGLYHFKESGSRNSINVFGTPPLAAMQGGSGSVDGSSDAVYGQVTWTPDILDQRLSITLGARYTDDHREGDNTVLEVTGNRIFFSDSKDFDSFDPAFIVNFAVNDDINTYAKVTTGYRAGGVYFGGASLDSSFDPEELTTYEVGVKSSWFDHRLRVNADIFLSKFDDMQIAVPVNLAFNSNIYNIGEATIKGFEMDVQASPTQDISLNLSYVYLDPKFDQVDVIPGSLYDRGINPASPYGPGDNLKDLFTLPYASDHSVSLGADYSFLYFDNGYLNAHIDYRWQSDYYGLANLGPAVPGRDFGKVDSYGVINARLTLSLDLPRGDKATVSLWGKNITDRKYETPKLALGLNVPTLESPAGFYGKAVQWGEPASYGVSLVYEY